MRKETTTVLMDGKRITEKELFTLLNQPVKETSYIVYVVTMPNVPDVTTGMAKEPKPVAGHPRTQVGTKIDKGEVHGIFVGTGMPGLLEVVSKPGEPDAYVDRGYNLEYDLLPGVVRPTGPATEWGGNDPVPGAKREDGYRIRYYGDGRAFNEQSDQPDEVYTAPQVIPAVSPSFQDKHYYESV